MLSWFKRKAPKPGAGPDGLCEVRVVGRDGAIQVPRDSLLLSAALAQGLAYPHNCRVGTCGECKTLLISGDIKPMMDFALSPLSAADLRAGCILACQSKVRGDLVIEVALGTHAGPAVVERAAVVDRVEWLPGDVVSLRLSLDAPLVFTAGQYAELSIDGFAAVRAYSFCDAPAPGGNAQVSFLIKRLPGGHFSERLFAVARQGLTMRLRGPFGSMGIVDGEADALCVAGGTGLAPMLSILRDRLRRSGSSRYTLLFGARSLHDHFAAALLAELEREAAGRLHVHVVLSDEPDDSVWNGARGLVTDAIGEASVRALPARAAYLCGAQGLVHTARARLVELGLPIDAIHADAFTPSGPAVPAA